MNLQNSESSAESLFSKNQSAQFSGFLPTPSHQESQRTEAEQSIGRGLGGLHKREIMPATCREAAGSD